jgi:hypothetical protein
VKLSDRISKYLDQCEPAVAGQHGHDRTFAVAAKLTWGFGLTVEEAYPFMLSFNSHCDPPWNERHLRRKLQQALAHHSHTKPRGYLLGDTLTHIPPNLPLTQLEPTWPQPDLTTIEQIVLSGPRLCDLWELSVVRFEDNKSHAEEIIDVLLPGNPLLCVGKSNYEFATRRREIWRGRLASLSLLVPAPMLAIKGQTQDGSESEHSKDATAKRVYQVVEFDFSERDKNGNDTIWRPLIRKWRKDDIEIVDACAALISHLRKNLPTLVCVVFSGGKSLHSWFRVFELTPDARRKFMREAVRLGADRATFTRSQFVRIPDGLRDNGRRQICYFLNPREAVRV